MKGFILLIFVLNFNLFAVDMNMQILQEIKQLRDDMNKKFEQVDKRFEQVDKRFKQVDKRFEQIDKRLNSIENIIYILMGLVFASPFVAIYLKDKKEQEYQKNIELVRSMLFALRELAQNDEKVAKSLKVANLM